MKRIIDITRKELLHNIKLIVHNIVTYIKSKKISHTILIDSEIEKVKIINYIKAFDIFEHKIAIKADILDNKAKIPMLVVKLDSSLVGDIDNSILTDLYYVTE